MRDDSAIDRGEVARIGTPDDLPVRSGASWLISYADLVTILLSFMILLLSVSGLNQAKFEILLSSLSGKSEGTLQQVQQRLDEIIESQGLAGEVETRLDPDGLKVSFSSALLFPSGSDQLTERGRSVFLPIADQLARTLEPKFGLVIEGHTDDVPIQTQAFHSNWELSAARAIHVMRRLNEAGLRKERLSIQGFADTRPADAPFGDTAFGDTAFGDTALGDTALGDTALGDTALGDTALGDTAPGDTALGDTALGDTALGDTAPGEAPAAALEARRAASRRVVIRIDTLDPAGQRLLLGEGTGWSGPDRGARLDGPDREGKAR